MTRASTSWENFAQHVRALHTRKVTTAIYTLTHLRVHLRRRMYIWDTCMSVNLCIVGKTFKEGGIRHRRISADANSRDTRKE